LGESGLLWSLYLPTFRPVNIKLALGDVAFWECDAVGVHGGSGDWELCSDGCGDNLYSVASSVLVTKIFSRNVE
jgi:hypothetical protein